MDNNNTISLWHGGRNLSKYDLEFKTPKKDRWEYGPGLYLSTHYETARKYAKGGGTTYLITLENGNSLENSKIPISNICQFAEQHVIKSKQKAFLDDIYDNAKRTSTYPDVQAYVFLNLIINNEAVKASNIKELNKFIVSQNIDYSKVGRYAGRDETIFIIFNLAKIKQIKPMSSQQATLELYELSPHFKEHHASPKP